MAFNMEHLQDKRMLRFGMSICYCFTNMRSIIDGLMIIFH